MRLSGHPRRSRRAVVLAVVGSSLTMVFVACKEPKSGYRERPSVDAFPDPVPVPDAGVGTARPADFRGEARVSLPVERQLVDNQGRVLDGRIIGKDNVSLTVIKRLDGKRYAVPIASLSAVDQKFAYRLLNQRPPPEDIEGDEKRQPGGGMIAGMEKQIERIDRELRVIGRQLQDPTLAENSPRRRGMLKEQNRLKSERNKLELGIERIERDRFRE